MFGAIFVNLGYIFVSFWRHFGALGCHLATRAPQGIPQGSRVEKVTKKLVRGSSPESLNMHSVFTEWSFLKFVFFSDVAKLPFCTHRTQFCDGNVGSWVLPGGCQFQQNPRKFDKRSLGGARWKALCARCCTRGASGPPPTMKTMVSFIRNHRLHSSPGGPKQPKMMFNRYLLGHLWVGFWPSGTTFRGTGNRLKIGVEIRSPGHASHAGLYLPGGPPALRTTIPDLPEVW